MCEKLTPVTVQSRQQIPLQLQAGKYAVAGLRLLLLVSILPGKQAEMPQDACPQASGAAAQLYAVLAGFVEGKRDSLIACNAIISVLFVSADTALTRSRQARATNSPQASVRGSCRMERDQKRHVYVDFPDTIVSICISSNTARALYTVPRTSPSQCA